MSWQAQAWAVRQDPKTPDETRAPCGRKFCLVMLASWSQADGLAWGTHERLARETNQGLSTVRQHLARLEELGYIARYDRRDSKGQRKGDGYVLDPADHFGLAERLDGDRDITAPGKLKQAVVQDPDQVEAMAAELEAKIDGDSQPPDPGGRDESQPPDPGGRPTARSQQANRQISASQPPDLGGTYSRVNSLTNESPESRARDAAGEGGDAPTLEPTDAPDGWPKSYAGVHLFLQALGNPADQVRDHVRTMQDVVARRFELSPRDASLALWALFREIHFEGKTGVALRERLRHKLHIYDAKGLMAMTKAAKAAHDEADKRAAATPDE